MKFLKRTLLVSSLSLFLTTPVFANEINFNKSNLYVCENRVNKNYCNEHKENVQYCKTQRKNMNSRNYFTQNKNIRNCCR